MHSSVSGKRNLKILFWNPRSITNKKEELLKISRDLHIIVCVESWLDPIKDPELHISGFRTFRKDRNGSRGRGILFLIRNGIAYHELLNLRCQHASVEIAGVRITDVTPPIDLVACYRVPGDTLPRVERDNILYNISNSQNAILMGDFNAHHQYWNCQGTEANGSNLLDSFLEPNSLCITPTPKLTLTQ